MDQTNRKFHITSAMAGSKVKIKGAPGVLGKVVINTTSAQALTCYDSISISAPANPFAVIKASILEQSLGYELCFDVGLVIDVPGSYTGSATICFR